MNDLISQIASKAGMDENMTEKGMGALLSTIQKHAPEGVFSTIADAVPDSQSILSKFQSLPDDGESSMGTGLLSMATGLFGGKSQQISTLLSMFSKGGFSLEMVKGFLPQVLSYFQDNGSEGVVDAISQVIPGLSDFTGGSESGGLKDAISKFF